ncbi:hypothetical protein D3C81_896420 [compost metagenome]
MQRAVRIGCIVAQQVKDAAALERRCTPIVLFQRGTAKGVEQDFQRGVGADLMQGLALVLEDFLAGHVLGIQHATLGGTVHVFHQIAG